MQTSQKCNPRRYLISKAGEEFIRRMDDLPSARKKLLCDVCGNIDGVRKRRDDDVEASLDVFENFLIFLGVRADEADGESFGTETPGTSDAMQILIGLVWHVVVDDDVNALDVNTASEKIGRHQNTLREVLEGLEFFDALFLAQSSVNADGRKVALLQKPVELSGARDLGDENDDLVELESIQKVVQFAILLRLFQADKVLLKTVEGQLGVVVDVNLGRLHFLR